MTSVQESIMCSIVYHAPWKAPTLRLPLMKIPSIKARLLKVNSGTSFTEMENIIINHAKKAFDTYSDTKDENLTVSLIAVEARPKGLKIAYQVDDEESWNLVMNTHMENLDKGISQSIADVPLLEVFVTVQVQ
jgi:hypothetical protein